MKHVPCNLEPKVSPLVLVLFLLLLLLSFFLLKNYTYNCTFGPYKDSFVRKLLDSDN